MSARNYSAAQVIYLAAWGTTEPPSDARESELRRRIAERWGTGAPALRPIERIGGERRQWLVLAMRRTLIRCRWRLKHGPITEAKWPRLEPELAKARAEKWRNALRPADRYDRQRARILAQLSERSMADLMSELRADLRPLYELRGRQFDQVENATLRIKKDILAGRIEAWGRAVEVGQEDRPSEYEKVPVSYFGPKWRTITLEDKACCDPDAPLSELISKEREWHQLRFHRGDAERLYRPVAVGDQGVPGSQSSRIAAFRAAKEATPEVSLDDLPAYWTIGQTIAWIMFRHPPLVHNVAATGARRLDALLAEAAHESPNRGLTDRATADAQLLTRVRAGDLSAKGLIAGRTVAQTMDPLDWIQGRLGEERDHIVVGVNRSGQFWYDVMLPKEAVTVAWPIVGNHLEHATSSRSELPPELHLHLPQNAWIEAHHAFACLAFGTPTVLVDITTQLKVTADPYRDPKLQLLLQRLSSVADHVLWLVQAGTCPAYVQVAGTVEMRSLEPWIFSRGIAFHLFSGSLDRDHADLDAGHAIHAALKAAGMDGVVWFKREELLAALSVRSPDPSSAATNEPPVALAEDRPPLRRALAEQIHATIGEVYDFATANRMKAPNLNQVVKPVQCRLESAHLSATGVKIKELAGDARYASRRGKSGCRLYSSLLPFSDSQTWKAGVQS
jgi:hypothetical protein